MTGLVNPARSRFRKGSIAAVAVTKVEIVALGGAEQQTKHQPEGNRRDNQGPDYFHPLTFHDKALRSMSDRFRPHYLRA